MKRFPLGLTVAAALAFSALAALGVWQVRRLAWKEALLAHIAALREAPPRPIQTVLADLSRGRSVDFVRAAATCRTLGGAGPRPAIFRYALDGEQVAWRLISACPLLAPPYDGVLVDRGLAQSLTGAMAPRAISVPPPRAVTGVLRVPPDWPFGSAGAPQVSGGVVILRLLDARSLRAAGHLAGLAHPAPVLLEVERQQPPAPGLVARAPPVEISNNHLAYALTWFALAAILAWFYAALLVRWARGS